MSRVGKSYNYPFRRFLVSNLDEAKQLAEKFMTNELEMLEKLATLDDFETHDFNNWFRTHKLFTSIPKRMAELNEIRLNNNIKRET